MLKFAQFPALRPRVAPRRRFPTLRGSFAFSSVFSLSGVGVPALPRGRGGSHYAGIPGTSRSAGPPRPLGGGSQRGGLWISALSRAD